MLHHIYRFRRWLYGLLSLGMILGILFGPVMLAHSLPIPSGGIDAR